MHVGLLTQYFPPEMGAPQARLAELGERIVARGHKVSVITAMPNYPTGKVFEGYGGFLVKERLRGMDVARTYIRPTQKVSTFQRLLSYSSFTASSAVAGARHLRSIDFLLTESPPLFLGVTGFMLSRVKKAKWIFNVSDLWPESAVALGALHEGRALRLAERLEAFCYARAWLVTGQTREIVADIEARHPSTRTYHLSNGVDTSLFRPEERDTRLRESLAPQASVVAVYAGLHGLAQGLDQVLNVANRLRDLSGLQIVLIGDGSEKRALVQRARELDLPNVTFLPPVPKEQVPSILASADIALIPLRRSLKGAVPSKLYEAMASGVPAVLVSEGEASNILQAAKAGLSVSPGDLIGLEQAIRTLAADRELRNSFGQAGRVAAQGFSRDEIAGNFIDFLETAT